MKATDKRTELGILISKLEELSTRIEKLEGAVGAGNAVETNTAAQHPSLAKFAIAEAIADEIFGHAANDKTCTFEPNGRPCDHCSMCSARGF